MHDFLMHNATKKVLKSAGFQDFSVGIFDNYYFMLKVM